jgi:hypothetical protein
MAKNLDLDRWGVEYNESVPHSNGFRCENSECSWNIPKDFSWLQYIVGYHEGIQAIIIIECPKCFEKFWIHCRSAKDYLARFCPNWPEK